MDCPKCDVPFLAHDRVGSVNLPPYAESSKYFKMRIVCPARPGVGSMFLPCSLGVLLLQLVPLSRLSSDRPVVMVFSSGEAFRGC